MLHGFHFVIKDKDLKMLNVLPRNFEIYNNNVGINVLYNFEYQITDWRTWNKLARIRASIQHLIPDIIWKDYVRSDCSIKCVESDFNSIIDKDIKFYPSIDIKTGERKEVLQALGIECKNLWYQNYFFIEKVIAFSLWLSATYKDNKYVSVSNRQSIGRAFNSYDSFNEIKADYKQRLSSKDRKEAYAKRNTLRDTKSFKSEVLVLINKGVSNKELMKTYSVTRMTLSRWRKTQ